MRGKKRCNSLGHTCSFPKCDYLYVNGDCHQEDKDLVSCLQDILGIWTQYYLRLY